jgi:hypothetical protein
VFDGVAERLRKCRVCPLHGNQWVSRSRLIRGKTVRSEGDAVIRQAISCDICGSEKKQTNHWFVAYDQGGELRVSGWSSRNRLRPGSKHLCGQTCLHKLVDNFMAKALAMPVRPSAEDEVMEQAAGADASLTSNTAYGEIESSARLITAPAPVVPVRPPQRKPVELVPMPARVHAEEAASLADEPPRYASRNWRAEAWDRERVRAARAGERRPMLTALRRSGS